MRRAQETCTCEIPGLSAVLRARDNTAVLDLRQPGDFETGRLPGAINLPLTHPCAKSPFFDPSALRSLWTQLEQEFETPSIALRGVQDRKVLVVCYDGDSARVASSVMRAKGYEANSLRSGLDGLVAMLSAPRACIKPIPEKETTWLQLCEDLRLPAASVKVPSSNSSSSKLGSSQHAAVSV